MTPRYRYGHYEGYDLRSQNRLTNDLGFDEAAAEMILRLRTQVLELQTQLRQLEAEQSAQATSQQLRLTPYREFYFEATWIELDFQE